MGEVMEDEEMVDSYLQQKFIEEEETEQPSAEIHNPTIINGEFLQEPETSMNQTVQLSNSVAFLSDIVENLPDANNTYGVIVTSKAMDEIENHGHKEKPNLESVVDAKDPVPEADVMDESKSNSGEKESHFDSILDANNNACAFANVTDESKNNVDEKEPHSEVAGDAKDAADAEASAMDESKSNGDEKEPLLEPVLVVKNPVEADVMDESEGNCDEANAMNEGKSNGGVKESHVEPIDDAKKEATDANTVDESKRNGDEKELDFKHVVDADANAVNESKRNYDKKKSPIEYAGYAKDASTMNAMVESKENGDETKKELHSEPLIDANNNADGSKENGDDDMDTASLSLVKAAALKIGDSDMKNIEKNGSEVTGALLSKEHSGKESVKQEFLVKEYQVSPKISYLYTHDNDDLSGTEEEQVAFVKELENFFEEKKMEFKPPKFYGKELNCLKLWRAVARLGGYDQVVAGKLWKQVGGNFNPPKTCTTVSWTFRGFYEKALLEYERSNMHGCDLRVPFASPADSISTENQVGDHQASGSGRVRSDAAGRATKGWHSQGFLGNGEADDRIVKDKTPMSMPVQENRMETDGVGKKSFKLEPATRTVQTIAKPTKPRMETTVMDIGAPADWVKINIRKTKDCFEVYALVPGLLREEVRVQSDPAGRLVISGEPEKPDNPWGVTPFKKVVMLPSRIDPANTSAVVTLHGQLFVRAPFEQSNA